MSTTMTKPEKREVRNWRLDPLASLREEMDSLLSHFTTERPDAWLLGRAVPSCDVSETNGEIQVKLDLPGMKAEDIEIQLSGNQLTISGQREERSEEKGRTFHRAERRRGIFSRTLTLPCPVLEDQVDAHYQDGVLTITVPKTEESRTKKIKVRT